MIDVVASCGDQGLAFRHEQQTIGPWVRAESSDAIAPRLRTPIGMSISYDDHLMLGVAGEMSAVNLFWRFPVILVDVPTAPPPRLDQRKDGVQAAYLNKTFIRRRSSMKPIDRVSFDLTPDQISILAFCDRNL